MKNYAVIVAGGSGTRMQSMIPKQFLLLQAKPVLMHTLSRFYDAKLQLTLIVVLPESYIDYWKELCLRHHFIIPHEIVKGGETRFESVKNGITLITENGLVAVHDAVRPLISNTFIVNLYDTAGKQGNAVPVIQVNETIRIISGDSSKTVDRSGLRIVQTPQVFNSGTLKLAFNQQYNAAFTDEATVMEMAGEKIFLVDGEPSNIKITNQKDLIFAEAFLKSNS